MKHQLARWPCVLVGIVFGLCLAPNPTMAAAPPTVPPILYDLRFPAPAEQFAEIEMQVPTAGRESVELFMAVWSPGYYTREDYATRILRLSAHDPEGTLLPLAVVAPNRWRVETGGAAVVVVRYALRCAERSVTLNWVSEALGVLNGPATFLAVEGAAGWPHEVRVHPPPGWPRVMTALTALAMVEDGASFHFQAPDFDTLVDSPILAGALEVREFEVAGSRHVLVNGGDLNGWDGERAVVDLERMVRAMGEYWGLLPFERYLFLNVHRDGGGGLEHRDSTLVTAVPRRVAVPAGYAAWLGLSAHEYAHAFNGKRLRPLALGPFDYDDPPATESLWLVEGVTVYVTDLVLCRAGLRTLDQHLAALSRRIGQLQAAPGRRVQTLRESSLAVWNTGLSGLVQDLDQTVSYYVKGQVVGFLLDVEIQRATQGERSLRDLLRRAYARYSGARGFTPEELRRTAQEVVGEAAAVALGAWLDQALNSTEELDYEPMLDWYGLRFVELKGPEGGPPLNAWKLEVRDDATAAQRGRLEACGNSP